MWDTGLKEIYVFYQIKLNNQITERNLNCFLSFFSYLKTRHDYYSIHMSLFMERLKLRRTLWLTHPLFWEGPRTQKDAKCARKHKNNNKIPVYFDNIILDGHKSRHVTSNRFRYHTGFEKGSKF